MTKLQQLLAYEKANPELSRADAVIALGFSNAPEIKNKFTRPWPMPFRSLKWQLDNADPAEHEWIRQSYEEFMADQEGGAL